MTFCPRRVVARTRRIEIERADEVDFSAITPWELGIKRSLGKISFPAVSPMH